MRKRVRVVKSGDRLPLGCGRGLLFEEIFHTRWPEAKVSFEVSSGTLLIVDSFEPFGWSVGAQKELARTVMALLPSRVSGARFAHPL